MALITVGLVRAMRAIGTRLVALPTSFKQVLKAIYDFAAVVASLTAGQWLIFGWTGLNLNAFAVGLAVTAPSVLIILAARSLYAPIAYSRDTDILRSAWIAALAGGGGIIAAGTAGLMPWTAAGVVIFMAVLLALVGGARVWLRAVLNDRRSRVRERVVIYGAGEAGRQLLAALQERRNHDVLAFVDDSSALEGVRIGGVPVLSGGEIADIVRRLNADTIFLAMPSISMTARRTILTRLEPLEQTVRTVPDLEDIMQGKALLSQVRAISPEDLLGRDPVAPHAGLVTKVVKDRSILVTGAGGSIGSELCVQILRQEPAKLVLIEQSEFALYSVLERLRALTGDRFESIISGHLCTVEDETRMEQIFIEHDVDAVFHAAAYKHVPLVQANMVDAVRNNALGTVRLARAAVRAGVDTFVLVSTDKAVRPANVMGASKRLAELICRTLSHTQSSTRFALVRFGNVLDSSGSVAPIFRTQIENGGPVTVTHPEVTRYFMTLSEAAQLVIQAAGMAEGGDVFVLGMGEPVRIIDLAERMIRLAGYKPVISEAGPVAPGEIRIIFTGLRPGEKIREELFVQQSVEGTIHPLILREGPEALDPSELNGLVARLETACRTRDASLVRDVLAHRYVNLRQVSTEGETLDPTSDDLGSRVRT